MKKTEKNKKKKRIISKIIAFLLILVSIFFMGVVLYFKVLPLKHIIILFVVLGLIVTGVCYKLIGKSCLFTRIITSLIALALMFIQIFGVFYAFGTLDFLNKIVDTGYRLETYNVYILKDSDYSHIRNLSYKNVSIYESSSETYQKALKKFEDKLSFTKESVDSITKGVDNLLSKKSEALYLNETLMQIYKEEHEEEYSQLKILDNIEILNKIDGNFKNVDVTKKPFVLYLSGSDLEGSIKKISRSDVNILAVVNPKTGKILVINTPRDYYVNLPSKNAKDKLTHAGIYGIEESALSLGDLYDIDVNYYARVNFTSFIKIVDALGGIEVDSKYAFSYDGSTFKKGINKLNGKAALAFSRGRKMLPEGDISRGYNQQAVVAGIVSKLSDKTVLTKYTSILNSMESGVMTNLDKNILTKLVNMQLDESIKWEIENYMVKGKDAYNLTYSTGSSKVYVMEPVVDSVNEAKIKIQGVMGK